MYTLVTLNLFKLAIPKLKMYADVSPTGINELSNGYSICFFLKSVTSVSIMVWKMKNNISLTMFKLVNTHNSNTYCRILHT